MKNIRKIKSQYRDYETDYLGCPECGSDDLYETDEFIGAGTPERRNTNTDYEDYYNHGR